MNGLDGQRPDVGIQLLKLNRISVEAALRCLVPVLLDRSRLLNYYEFAALHTFSLEPTGPGSWHRIIEDRESPSESRL